MPEKKTTTPSPEKPKAEAKPRELFVVTTPASSADAELRVGQVAEAGAKILKTHAHLFKPLTVTYKA